MKSGFPTFSWQLLISAGAKLEIKDNTERSALYIAATFNHANIVEALILAGKKVLQSMEYFVDISGVQEKKKEVQKMLVIIFSLFSILVFIGNKTRIFCL